MFSNANKLNLKLIPKDLPIYIRVEKLIIICVYIYL